MSTADCRRCSGQISFVLGSNGRWRPVEASYTALELLEDEVIALRVDGNMAAQNQVEVRVYRYHRCPEDPSLRLGRPRTVVVGPDFDEQTGEVLDDPEVLPPGLRDEPDDDDEPEVPSPGRVHRRGWIEQAADRMPAAHRPVACPICKAEPETPCLTAQGHVRGTTHPERGYVTAFDDDQPWPPEPNQRGYAVMRRWLSQHGSVLTNPPPHPTEGAP